MLELDNKEKIIIKKFFDTNGYVFNFSTLSFDSFTFNSVGIKLCEKYRLSKGKSFCAFVDDYKTVLVIRLVNDLLEYYDIYKDDLPDYQIKANEYLKVKEIVKQFDYFNSGVINSDNSIDKLKSLSLKKYDVFISHASADKLAAVKDITDALYSLGINVWYDSNNLEWGDSIKCKIDQGLNNCEFGIVVISRTYFNSKWCNHEFFELLSRQNKEGQRIILPLLLNVSITEAIEKYPDLGDIKMIEYQKGNEKDIALFFVKTLLKRYRIIMEKV